MPPEPGPLPDADLVRRVEERLLGDIPTLTRAEVAEQAGVPLELAEQLWHSLGFPHAADEDRAFTQYDVEALLNTRTLIEAGILDEESQAALVRTWGRSFSRLADWQIDLLARVSLQADDPQRRLDEVTRTVLPLVESLQSYVWRRHLYGAASRWMVRAGDPVDTVEQAVGFVDIVGYTSQSRNLSEAELVDLVDHFEDVAAGLVTDHDGLLIKTIGDEVLFVAPSAVQAARIALELVERHSCDDAFPKVRAGVAYGDVVSRLGDVYGPTVNIAARLTSIARPGRVLTDRGMHAALSAADPDRGEFRFRRVRRTSVKGYHRLESFRLLRPAPPDQE